MNYKTRKRQDQKLLEYWLVYFEKNLYRETPTNTFLEVGFLSFSYLVNYCVCESWIQYQVQLTRVKSFSV